MSRVLPPSLCMSVAAVALLLLPLPARAGSLGLSDRVAARRAIERIQHDQRIWPKENPTPKPSFEEAVPPSASLAAVREGLLMSDALDHFWGRPLTGEQLLGEMDRIASSTRDPETLRQVFAALGNDPRLLAECVARPILAERLLRTWYGFDPRWNGEMRATVARLRATLTPANFAESGDGTRVDVALVVGGGDSRPVPRDGEPREERVGRDEFDRVASLFPPPGSVSWDETPESFVARLTTTRSATRLEGIVRVFPKRPFDDWFESVQGELSEDRVVEPQSRSWVAPQASLSGSFRPDNWFLDGDSPVRTGHTAVWTGAEMIVFGGWGDGSSPLSVGVRYDPALDSWTPTSPDGAPVPRYDHTAVWTGEEMIVWGGIGDAGDLNSGGRYSPTLDRWIATGTTSAPVGRSEHTAVWTGNEMIVWGGRNPSCLQSGGRLNPVTNVWTAVTTASAPLARTKHTAVWTGNEMIVWGGGDPNLAAVYNTGGRYSPATNSWLATSTVSAATARQLHTAVWSGTRMIVWGGDFFGPLATGGIYNPGTDSWSALSTTSAPSIRSRHTAVWTGNEMIVWGGGDQNSSTYRNDGGRYSLATNTWTALGSPGFLAGRYDHTAVWTGREMIVWGGYGNQRPLGTGYRYSPTLDTWVPTALNLGPTPRRNHTATWTGAELVVFGGYLYAQDGTHTNTGGRYHPAFDAWRPTRTSGAPTARGQHTAVWTGSQVVVWGGYDPNPPATYFDTGGRYTPSTNLWTTTTATNAPARRYGHTAVWTGTYLVVWGGTGCTDAPTCSTFGLLGTGARWQSNVWTALPTAGAPTARTGHSAVWTGSQMIVWGGDPGGGATNTGGIYSAASNSWGTAPTTSGAPAARSGHTAVWTGTEMIVWGGSNGGGLGTGGRYVPSPEGWTATTATGAPSARYDHTAVWTGREMIVWGGWSGGLLSSTGGRYRPSPEGWIATPASGAPVARAQHRAVWTGQEMLLFGGDPFSSLASFVPDSPPTSSPKTQVNGVDGGTVVLGGADDTLRLTQTLATSWFDDVEGSDRWTPTGTWSVVHGGNCTGISDFVSPARAWSVGNPTTCSYATASTTSTLTSIPSFVVTANSLLACRSFLQTDATQNFSTAGFPAIAVPGGNTVGITSTIPVYESRTILDVNVRVHISTTYDGDMAIYLKGPSGLEILLGDANGAGGDDFLFTVFDDEAATLISAGAAPFSGPYRPEALLSQFDGLSTAGAWTLRVADTVSADAAVLESWDITFTTSGSNGDTATIEVGSGSTWTRVATDATHRGAPADGAVLDDTGNGWRGISVRLADFVAVGSTVQVRFSFTRDSFANEGVGWLLDDIAVGEPQGDGSNAQTTLPYHDKWDHPSFAWFVNEATPPAADAVPDNLTPESPSFDILESNLAAHGMEAPGSYTCWLRVTDLSGASADAPVTVTVVDGIPPSATVLSPNGGESLDYSPATTNRRTHFLVWSATDNRTIVRTRLSWSADGGSSWTCLADSSNPVGCPAANLAGSDTLAPGDQSFLWAMPTAGEAAAASPAQQLPSALGRLRLEAWDESSNLATDTSNANFYLVQPTTTAIRTTILWNSTRFEARFGTPAKTSMAAKLGELAAHNKVIGVVLDLASVPAVTSALASWDGSPTDSGLANAAAAAIRSYLVGQVTATYTNVQFLVLVGDDQQIPFYRMLDGASIYAESVYPGEVGLSTATTVGGAIAAGRFLTDNYYSELSPESSPMAPPHDQVFLNDLATGRLVETPSQIEGVVNTFLAQDGQVDMTVVGSRFLVTGFDFLHDSAAAVRGLFAAKKPTDCLLDDPERAINVDPCDDLAYTPTDLLTQLLGPTRHAVANVNTHAAHTGWATSTGILSTAAMDADPDLLPGTVLFSSGCHSGLPVPPADPQPLDLPEVMAKKKVLAYVGNTGYGWGLRSGSGLTERLMENLARELTAVNSVSIGKALANAKRTYHLEERRWDVFDEKVMHQLTLFGIPNTLLVHSIGASSKGTGTDGTNEELPVAADPRDAGCADGICVKKAISTADDAPATTPSIAAIPPGVIQLDLNFTFGSGTYQLVNTLAGKYYKLNGRASGEVGDSVQPHFVYNSYLSGTNAHGVLFVGGAYTTESAFNAVIGTPNSTAYQPGSEGQLPFTRTSIPGMTSSFGSSPSYGISDKGIAPAAIGQFGYTNLVVHTGTWDSQTQVQSRFSDMAFVSWFSNSTDVTPPVVVDPGAGGFHSLSGLDASFSVQATDASGVHRVLILYDDTRVARWKAADLSWNVSTSRWEGTLSLLGSISYYVAAVDNAGNVGILSVSGSDLDPSAVAYGSTWSGPKLFAIELADTDGDGLPNAFESLHPCLDGAVPDAASDDDDDLLTAAVEFSSGLDPCDGDGDGGGDNDGSEVSEGRDPFDPADDLALTITVAPIAGGYRVSWPPASGNNAAISGKYFVYRASVPHFGPADRINPVALADGVSSWDDTSASCGTCFYKVWNVALDTPPPVVSVVVPSSGPTGGGTAVEIFGTGFAEGATVTFGGNAATSVVVQNGSRITAVTPAGVAGPGVVVVTNPNGQAHTLTAGYTYTP